MLVILRFIVVIIYGILICIGGTLYCLFNPRNSRNIYLFSQFFGKLSKVLGLKIKVRQPNQRPKGQVVYIANHQNNYDLIVGAYIFQPHTVTVGKKSLLWVPFFGVLYWLTGNLLIDRKNKSKAHSMIKQVALAMRKKKISIWMFPEGTRSRGRGLLSFKTGAFHAAIEAGVPIVPVCISNLHNKINLNRLDNGYVLIEMLPEIDTTKYTKHQVHQLAKECHQLMQQHIQHLDKEVVQLEAQR